MLIILLVESHEWHILCPKIEPVQLVAWVTDLMYKTVQNHAMLCCKFEDTVKVKDCLLKFCHYSPYKMYVIPV